MDSLQLLPLQSHLNVHAKVTYTPGCSQVMNEHSEGVLDLAISSWWRVSQTGNLCSRSSRQPGQECIGATLLIWNFLTWILPSLSLVTCVWSASQLEGSAIYSCSLSPLSVMGFFSLNACLHLILTWVLLLREYELMHSLRYHWLSPLVGYASHHSRF